MNNSTLTLGELDEMNKFLERENGRKLNKEEIGNLNRLMMNKKIINQKPLARHCGEHL